MNRKLWPNLLSATRIALMPAVLGSAIAGSRVWFTVLIAVSLATDALDGYFARRFHAFSELGRKLDSAADYVTLVTGVTGIALLWPEIMRRELPWVVTGMVSFFAVIIYGFIRLGHAPCYHTWASKTGAVVCPVTLVPLLNEWTAVPFHLTILWLVLTGIEEIAISLVVPRHVGEMPTLWHAVRARRGRVRAGGAGSAE
ncbi:MAG: CDP-alcohol phosphatidyltransferase family protein [Verrucomicrobia bacterium]|nr:CDP-alcohol phosphatidyltransferase family protein [Verrucomicrobiota bacterium]